MQLKTFWRENFNTIHMKWSDNKLDHNIWSPQRESNLDLQSRRRVRWPLDHHQFEWVIAAFWGYAEPKKKTLQENCHFGADNSPFSTEILSPKICPTTTTTTATTTLRPACSRKTHFYPHSCFLSTTGSPTLKALTLFLRSRDGYTEIVTSSLPKWRCEVLH